MTRPILIAQLIDLHMKSSVALARGKLGTAAALHRRAGAAALHDRAGPIPPAGLDGGLQIR